MVRLNEKNQLVRNGEILRGTWALTRDHEIRFRRAGTRRELVLSGPIRRAEPLALAFRVAESTVEEDVIGRELSLRGSWQADDRNRLSFLVEGARGRPDRLTLQGAWRVGPTQEILYRWSGRNRLLRFEGAWDVDESRRLVYVLDRSSDSGFRFSGAFQTPSILPKRGELRYQLGAQVQKGRKRPTVTLFGKWKVSDQWEIRFEMPYRQGRRRSIDFGASYRLDKIGEIACQLRTRRGESLGMEVTLTRGFLKGQGESFVHLRRSLEESAVEGGLRFRW